MFKNIFKPNAKETRRTNKFINNSQEYDKENFNSNNSFSFETESQENKKTDIFKETTKKELPAKFVEELFDLELELEKDTIDINIVTQLL